MKKNEIIDKFLHELAQENAKKPVVGFSVVCGKCGSSNVTIYHACNYYAYSSYTQGFDASCGLKCKNCGNAAEIEIHS